MGIRRQLEVVENACNAYMLSMQTSFTSIITQHQSQPSSSIISFNKTIQNFRKKGKKAKLY